jgi:hypothetical protein
MLTLPLPPAGSKVVRERLKLRLDTCLHHRKITRHDARSLIQSSIGFDRHGWAALLGEGGERRADAVDGSGMNSHLDEFLLTEFRHSLRGGAGDHVGDIELSEHAAHDAKRQIADFALELCEIAIHRKRRVAHQPARLNRPGRPAFCKSLRIGGRVGVACVLLDLACGLADCCQKPISVLPDVDL